MALVYDMLSDDPATAELEQKTALVDWRYQHRAPWETLDSIRSEVLGLPAPIQTQAQTASAAPSEFIFEGQSFKTGVDPVTGRAALNYPGFVYMGTEKPSAERISPELPIRYSEIGEQAAREAYDTKRNRVMEAFALRMPEPINQKAPRLMTFTTPDGRNVSALVNPSGSASMLPSERKPDFTGKVIDELLRERRDIVPDTRSLLENVRKEAQTALDQVTSELRNLGVTNFPGTSSMLRTNAPAVGIERVLVIAPDGRRGTLPKSQVAEALREGYRLP